MVRLGLLLEVVVGDIGVIAILRGIRTDRRVEVRNSGSKRVGRFLGLDGVCGSGSDSGSLGCGTNPEVLDSIDAKIFAICS
jgi:hypothetical protein